MDVLLINPFVESVPKDDVAAPLGLASMGCVLEKNGYSVEILDLQVKQRDFDVYGFIRSRSPKITGISGTSSSRFESFRLSTIVKQVSDRIVTIYGGCHATFTAEDTLTHCKDVDYVARGEGEMVLLDLALAVISHKFSPEAVLGLSFLKNGKVVHNPPRKRILNLDDIPYSRHLLETGKYVSRLDFLQLPATTIITSRGCPFRCSFCSAGAMFDSVYTARSAKNIADEIEYCIKNFGIKGIKFYDSTFTVNRGRVLSFTDEVKKRRIDLPWECEIRVNTVDRDLLKAMKEAGCYYVDFGIESASERILNIMNKDISLGEARNVMKWCRDLGILTKVFFSFGHIGETWSDSMETFRFIDKYRKYISKLSISQGILIYPGTRVERYAKENGLLPEGFSWSVRREERSAGADVSGDIPILLQPSYGLKELGKCRHEIYWIELKRDLLKKHGFAGKLKNIGSAHELLRKILKLLITILNLPKNRWNGKRG